jgi:LysM repeat protein
MTAIAAVDTLYTVALGDSLSKLAQRYYGDPAKFGVIAVRNNVNPQAILMVGQRLIIPAAPPAAGTGEESTAVVAPSSPGGTSVQQGIETVTVSASVWWKDWRYWAGIGVALGVGYYLLRGRKR